MLCLPFSYIHIIAYFAHFIKSAGAPNNRALLTGGDVIDFDGKKNTCSGEVILRAQAKRGRIGALVQRKLSALPTEGSHILQSLCFLQFSDRRPHPTNLF